MRKMRGSTCWIGKQEVDQAETRRVILRDDETLAIEFSIDGVNYDCSLRLAGDAIFRGEWSYIQGTRTYTGTASCKLYRHGTDTLLFGTWHQAQVAHYWWAELAHVDQFDDEPASS